jgi:hypothetical protein
VKLLLRPITSGTDPKKDKEGYLKALGNRNKNKAHQDKPTN